MRKVLLASSVLALALIIPFGVMSLSPSKLSVFLVGATPTPDLFDPAYYGVPDTIAGHEVLAVISAENTRCVPPNLLKLIVRVEAPDYMSYLRSDEARDLRAAMKEFEHPGKELTLEVIGPTVSLDNMQAETEGWNQAMSDGCHNFWGGSLPMPVTPNPLATPPSLYDLGD